MVFASPEIDLEWIPDSVRVVLVHNDSSLVRERVCHPGVEHVEAGGNVGFGAAVNRALAHVETERVVLCNPDARLTPEHWNALVDAAPDELVTVPLADGDGAPTSVTSAYPTPLTHLVSGYRLGRWVPRGRASRAWAGRALGSWGRAHVDSLESPTGTWALSERWASGAVLSVDAARLRDIGGFDDRYFLYYEDVDLCRRMSAADPSLRVRVAATSPGVHTVGASGTRSTPADAERARVTSAVRYAHDEHGIGWRSCERLLARRARAMGAVL